jgi:hypothetical protein
MSGGTRVEPDRILHPGLAVALGQFPTLRPESGLQVREIAAALEADFAAIDRLVRWAIHRSHAAAGSR